MPAPPGNAGRRPKIETSEPAPQEAAGPAENRTPSTAEDHPNRRDFYVSG
jgi:hypothetical protein